MEIAKISVIGNKLQITQHCSVTRGMVGATVVFEAFGPEWDGLSKTAVFRAKTTTRDVVNVQADQPEAIPWEVVATAAAELEVGVYGRNEEGTLVIPTVWGSLRRIEGGAVPEGRPSEPPTPDWTAQIEGQVQQTLEEIQAVRPMIGQAAEAKDAAVAAKGTAVAAAEKAQKAADAVRDISAQVEQVDSLTQRAEAAAGSASAAQTAAAESTQSAKTAMDQAGISAKHARLDANAAAQSAQQAGTAAGTAVGAAGMAGQSAEAAAGSASAAADDAQTATDAVASIGTSVQDAQTAATTATQAAERAETEAGKVSTALEGAAGSADTAAQSAQQAAGSAGDASDAAGRASSAASAAAQSAKAASSAQESAAGSATQASGSAAAASGAAGRAETAAADASNAAGAAATSAEAASGAAQTASTAANTATTQAGKALEQANRAKAEADRSAEAAALSIAHGITGAKKGDLMRVLDVDGKGVPTALEPVSFADLADKWEKIDVLKSEGQAVISQNQYPDGSRYNLKSVSVVIKTPAGTHTAPQVEIAMFQKVGDTVRAYVPVTEVNQKTFFRITAMDIGGRIRVSGVVRNTGDEITTVYNMFKNNGLVVANGGIEEIRFTDMSGVGFSAGTTFEIEGVKN